MHDRVPVDQLDLSLQQEVIHRHSSFLGLLLLNLLCQLDFALACGPNVRLPRHILHLLVLAAQKEILYAELCLRAHLEVYRIALLLCVCEVGHDLSSLVDTNVGHADFLEAFHLLTHASDIDVGEQAP